MLPFSQKMIPARSPDRGPGLSSSGGVRVNCSPRAAAAILVSRREASLVTPFFKEEDNGSTELAEVLPPL